MTVQQIITIAVIAAILIGLTIMIIAAIRTGNYKYLAAFALKCVTEAEEEYAIEGQKTGATKYGVVAKQIVEHLPPILQPFISAKTVDNLIEAAVAVLKEQLQKATD